MTGRVRMREGRLISPYVLALIPIIITPSKEGREERGNLPLTCYVMRSAVSLVEVAGTSGKAAASLTPISPFAVAKGFMYSSFLKPYNPRRSQSDVSIESQSSNESGYGGSSPVFSRQNSNSTLTFNQETATVSFCASQPAGQSSPHPSLDSASSSSRRSHPRDAPTHPDPPGTVDSVDSTQRNASSRREFSEATCRNAGGHRDPEASYRHHRDAYDPAYTGPRGQRGSPDPSADSHSTHRSDRSQRYGPGDKGYGSPQWRNGENASQKQRPTYSRDELIEPEQEKESDVDGHQVRPPAAPTHTHTHMKTHHVCRLEGGIILFF